MFAFSDARMGCYAEYKCMPQDGAVACKPLGLSYGEAAALSFGGTTALDFLRRAKLQRGESVLINGASGAVGAAAVQLARHFGAHVTAVCSNKNLAFVKKLGADVTIDYKATPLDSLKEKYDIFYDAFGSTPLTTAARLLVKGGKYITTTPRGLNIVRAIIPFVFGGPRVLMANLSTRKSGFELIEKLLVEEKLKAVIAEKFPLAKTREAYQSLKAGGHAGKVLITVVH